MNTATKTQTRNLKIDGMSGDACVKKVTSALNDVENVTTQSVRVGSAVISADTRGCDAACAGVTAAGFPTHEATIAPVKGDSRDSTTTHSDPKTHSDDKKDTASSKSPSSYATEKANTSKTPGTSTDHTDKPTQTPAKPAHATK
jgi:copper chaperone CopZ